MGRRGAGASPGQGGGIRGPEGRRPTGVPPALGAALAGTALLLALAGCEGRNYAPVSLQPAAPQGPSAAQPRAPLRVGLAPILSPRSGGEGLVSLCEAMSRRLDRPVVPMVGADYRETNDLLALGQLDVGIVCCGAFSDPRLDKLCEPLLVPLLAGTGTSYASLLIVRAQDPARCLEDLRGRDFVFTDSLSLTGYIHPVARLGALGETPATFFSRVSFSHSHDGSIAMVTGGTCSAAAVDSAVFAAWRDLHPRESSKVRILERSDPFPSPPLVVRSALPAAEKELLRKAFLDLAATVEGKRILAKIGWTGFLVPDAAYLQRMDRLRRLFGKLRGQNVLPA